MASAPREKRQQRMSEQPLPKLFEACVEAAMEYVEKLRGKDSEAQKRAKPQEVAMREALSQLLAERPLTELRRRSRLKVCGDENVRIRDHVKTRVRTLESRVRRYSKRPPVVKTVDKVLFTCGVAWVACTEYVLLQAPQRMAAWSFFSIAPLFVHRFVTYRKSGLVYFCLDFCYFVNVLCLLCYFTRSSDLFQVVFCLCNGPLVFAVVVWRNSFIFHSLDHVCSTMLHALPPLWTFTVRWAHTTPSDVSRQRERGTTTCFDDDGFDDDSDGSDGPLLGGFGVPRTYALALVTYALWQVLYVAKTEWLDRDYIKNSPQELTSLRWLIRDSRGAMYRLCKSFLVSWKLMSEDEEFDESTWRTKLTFWTAQFAYTFLTLLPVALMWRSRRVHAACLLTMYVLAVYNGASYYIEVFSRRYNLKFVEDASTPDDASLQAQSGVVSPQDEDDLLDEEEEDLDLDDDDDDDDDGVAFLGGDSDGDGGGGVDDGVGVDDDEEESSSSLATAVDLDAADKERERAVHFAAAEDAASSPAAVVVDDDNPRCRRRRSA